MAPEIQKKSLVAGEPLWKHYAQRSQHSPPSMDQLCLTVLLQRCRVRAKAGGVPATALGKNT